MSEEICATCSRGSPPKRGRGKKKKADCVKWISCDACLLWFHAVCVRISDEQMEKVDNFQFLCDNCCIRGCLIPKAPAPPITSPDVDALKKTVQELSARITELQAELAAVKAANKKQTDRVQSKLNSMDRACDQSASQGRLASNIGEKLEIIEKGAKLANTCSRTVNSSRLAINKVPYKEGEDVRALVESVLHLLDCGSEISHIARCFRLPVKPSKWTDRSISPTIVVIFDSIDTRQMVLRRYYDRHRDAKLCNLKNGLKLDYRFTINEVLSVNTFRLRNQALRLKQNGVVKSVFIRNDRVSVLIPGQKRYIPIESLDHLHELTAVSNTKDSSSIFFDAEANVSTSSRC